MASTFWDDLESASFRASLSMILFADDIDFQTDLLTKTTKPFSLVMQLNDSVQLNPSLADKKVKYVKKRISKSFESKQLSAPAADDAENFTQP